MHLPKLRYDCVSCGKSCTDFRVEVKAPDLPRLKNSRCTQALEREGFTPLQMVGDQVFLEKLEGGRCSYLNRETLCLLHQEGGFAHKPHTCQKFPFVVVDTPDGPFVGLSFYCTAVVQSQGRLLEGRQEELQFLIDSTAEAPAPDSQWSLWESQAVDWPNYLRIEAFCGAGIERDPQFGLLESAWRLGGAVAKGDPTALSKPLKSGGVDRKALQTLLGLVMARLESPEPGLGHPLTLETSLPHYPEWFQKELSRYLQHALFRKSLLSAPNVLSRVCVLALAGFLIAAYAYSHANHRQSELEVQDYHKAVGLVEGRLMLHAYGLEAFMEDCARGVLGLGWEQDG